MDTKTCYIISFWLGDRRRDIDIPKYPELQDRLFFLKKHIELLQSKKHNLTKIIFNFNIEPDQYHYLSEIYSITPKSLQGTEVEINIRENLGISYGAWSDLFVKYKTKYDYYVFNEDDYFFVQDNWDTYLVNKHNSYDDCGYLCMFIREPQSWTKFRKIAGSSVGIASSESLMKVYHKYGKLPSQTTHPEFGSKGNEVQDEFEEYYQQSQDIQNQFGFAFCEVGLNLYDIRDDYAVLFAKGAPESYPVKCDVWNIFPWNSTYLNVSYHYFFRYTWFSCSDLEFLENYSPTTYQETMMCYNQQFTYYEDSVDSLEETSHNGIIPGLIPPWVRRNYNI
jgi:hypothetical protein